VPLGRKKGSHTVITLDIIGKAVGPATLEHAIKFYRNAMKAAGQQVDEAALAAAVAAAESLIV